MKGEMIVSITYCEERKLFTLETRQTTYQMKVDACGQVCAAPDSVALFFIVSGSQHSTAVA